MLKALGSRGKRRTGVTLVEMILVLMVIGMAAMIVVPRWAGFTGAYDVKTEIRRMESLLRKYQQQAVKLQQPVRFVFDPDNEWYTIQQSDGVSFNTQEMVYLSGVNLDWVGFSSGPGPNTLEIDVLGQMSETGGLNMTDDKGRYGQLSVHTTGAIDAMP